MLGECFFDFFLKSFTDKSFLLYITFGVHFIFPCLGLNLHIEELCRFFTISYQVLTSINSDSKYLLKLMCPSLVYLYLYYTYLLDHQKTDYLSNNVTPERTSWPNPGVFTSSLSNVGNSSSWDKTSNCY